MKTLLTIGDTTYLMPDNTDPAKVLSLFAGMKATEDRHEWGPDEARYNDDLRLNKRVQSERASRVRVELVNDDDVVTEKEWKELAADRAKREAAWRTKRGDLPKAA